jgi:peptide/nickel transport system substrate-binding protein
MVGNKKDLQQPCWAVFICGTPLETSAGLGPWSKPAPENQAKAKALLAEAGYKGEPLVMMDPSADQPLISAMTKMSAQLLRNAGFNIDLQSMDWAALITRRSVKDDPATNRSGWNFFHTWGTGPLAANPLTNNTVATPCDGKNWFGWPCDEELNKLQQEFITTTSLDDQKKLADKFQTRFYQVVPFIPLGQFYQKIAYRNSLSGVLENPNLAFWNIEKK